MYNPVNAHVSSSGWLVNSQYVLHGMLLLVSLISIPVDFYHYLTPLFAVQAWHFRRFYKGELLYLQSRHWRIHNNRWFVQLAGKDMSEVQVSLQHLWPSLAIFKFKLNGRWQWEIIVKDAVDAESFRQLRAMLTLSNKRPQ